MSAKTRKILSIGIGLLALALLACTVLLWRSPPGTPDLESTPEPPPSVNAVPVPTGTPAPAMAATEPPSASPGLPVGKLVVTKERQGYVDGSLSIYIPILDMTRTIWNGTDEATLSKGVGLYEYAQLPGEGARNVSLAGHRNGLQNGVVTDRAPFYYVDTLKEGDYLYLTDADHIYRYLYAYTEIIEEDDWGPIYTTEGSCLTITSCHPIGVSDHRIVVRAALDEIFDTTDDFDYLSTRKEAPT